MAKLYPGNLLPHLHRGSGERRMRGDVGVLRRRRGGGGWLFRGLLCCLNGRSRRWLFCVGRGSFWGRGREVHIVSFFFLVGLDEMGER